MRVISWRVTAVRPAIVRTTAVAGLALGFLTGCPQTGTDKAGPAQPRKGAAKGPVAANTIKPDKGQQAAIKIVTALATDPRLKGISISVGSSPTTLTLNGTVNTADQKRIAESIAQPHARGFKLLNQLELKGSTAPARPPAAKR